MAHRLTGLLLAATLAIPAFAQLDVSGEWAPRFHEDQPERIPGPEIGDYLGLPINSAARLRADTWDASLLTLPEHQCKPHPSDYAWRGPANLRVWKEIDRESQQLVAYHTHISWEAPERTIWMDGRPHPPDYAAHTWQGFSTGKWEGDMLTITTTHLKNGWIRRNGVRPGSDRATVTEHMLRHGNYLTRRGGHQRSGISERALHTDHRFRVRCARQEHRSLSLRGGGRSGAAQGHCTEPSAWNEHISRRVPGGARPSRGAGARRSRDHVSGIPFEDQEHEARGENGHDGLQVSKRST